MDSVIRNIGLNWISEKAYHFKDSPYVEQSFQKLEENIKDLQEKLQKEINRIITNTPQEDTVSIQFYTYEQAVKNNLNIPSYIPKNINIRWIKLGSFDEGGPCGENNTFIEKEVQLGVRITNIHTSGKSLIFYDVQQEGVHLQILCNKQFYEKESDFNQINSLFKTEDIIGVTGRPHRNKNGKLSIFVNKIILLSPCLHMLPSLQSGLKDQDTRYRKRYLDLITNQEIRNIFITRTKVIQYLRNFLNNRNYLEVETPQINMIPAGEATLGGIERVYEIGKSFRNESIDRTHNPEQTSCELYQAYADYEYMIEIVETFLSGLVKEITGSYKINFHPQEKNYKTENFYEIDFTPPFKRLPIMPALSEKLGAIKFPENLEKVDCRNPTFITDYPNFMSPLAKYHRNKPSVNEKFQLFANFYQLCNGFTEINNPFVQRKNMLQQISDKNKRDNKAILYDKEFCECLEHGLCPAAGCRFEIDRIIMLLTDNINIQEVLLFPAIKPII
ncbi:lysyl tRNA synthetase family member krs-1, putative [Ichthyophthirius multifiliis]|uniref:Lysyl-tRNA synthetase n=1 Tax=Ichthyophthirius multifiliis TaxID=5932 RepID=G0QWC8_ICHMU|nr:lysyl tRNA synthetase family member krs-1, putative [Ichthyophthirius multifiliis]EGR30475.1 lysyl tRNA synthetase family member krs-1, putative [Ichthyophthirius multifiliis]|eukprot:XP_004032062.1 lysyl tRNA synthetase family member krs-1, putative [Ichthyophthirius multifiliis]